jgi:hypothetical protein
MSRTLSIAAFAALATAMVLGAACGGGSDSSKTTTPAADASASPYVRATPFATPQISGNLVDSEKGYTATFPAGWHVRANFVNTSDATTDAFFEPLPAQPQAGDVQASISVLCVLEKAPDANAYLSGVQTVTARLPQNSDIQVSERTISGIKATVETYRFASKQDPNAPQLDKQDVIFSSDRCDWTITTTAPAGQRDKYTAEFNGFLDSFKLK